MVTGEPTFAGVTLSQFMQLPKGVTVTLAGAGGQAPIISLTDPAALLPTPRPTTAPLAANINAGSTLTNRGGDTFTPTSLLGTNGPLNLGQPGQNVPLQMNTQGENEQGEDGGDKGKGKGKKGIPPGLAKKGGLPPGLAKQLDTGKEVAKGKAVAKEVAKGGNPWINSLQTGPGALQTLNGGAPTPQNLLAQPPVPPPAPPPPILQPQPNTTGVRPDPAESPLIPGLPRPTVPLSAEPGAIVQFGPPLV